MDDYEYGIPDPEYGVFGENAYDTRTRRTTNRDIDRKVNYPKQTFNSEKVSRDFNRAMIDLYNKANK